MSKLKKLRYSSLFGGGAEDLAGFNGDSLRLDSLGNCWIAGLTRSADLPAQGRFAGADDGFIASFTPGSSTARVATYFGGMGLEMLEGAVMTLITWGVICLALLSAASRNLLITRWGS